jgi:hypothetical protein
MLIEEKEKWYNKKLMVIILCLTIFPLGIYGLWKSTILPKSFKVAFIVLLIIACYDLLVNNSTNLNKVSVITFYVIFGIIAFFLWLSEKSNIAFFGTIAFLIFFFYLLMLSFHYLPSKGQIFAKENLTFSNTIITDDDISELISNYNKASLFEKTALRNEPLFRKLLQQNIIGETKREEEQENQPTN